MIQIPKQMSNEESKLYAKIVLAERSAAIAQADITAATNRLKKHHKHVLIWRG